MFEAKGADMRVFSLSSLLDSTHAHIVGRLGWSLTATFLEYYLLYTANFGAAFEKNVLTVAEQDEVTVHL